MPLPTVDPLSFIADDEVREFELDERWDLTATTVAQKPPAVVGTGNFIVHEHVVPENTGQIVFGIFPHCWRRENPGTLQEYLARLDPDDVAGAVLFDCSKNNNQPLITETKYNVPTIAGFGSNANMPVVRGSTWLARDAQLLTNVLLETPLRTIYCPPKSVFRVIFRLAPNQAYVAGPPPSGGMPDPWIIPNYAVPVATQHRIDCAGALVVGVRMPANVYERLRAGRRAGLLGPEAR